jgi:nicotinamide-nucleotide amidase
MGALFPDHITRLAEKVLAAARERGMILRTAESCTGGLIAAALTSIAGSSDVFDRGFVTYANQAKQEMLGVPEDMLEEYGAVSPQVAEAMVAGALQKCLILSPSKGETLDRDEENIIALSVTGIAGPGGGTKEKPVGLVWFGIGSVSSPINSEKIIFPNETRDAIRMAAMVHGLEMFLTVLVDNEAARQ